MAAYRVIQVLETNERVEAFEGSEEACYQWIEDNESNYPESQFFIEPIEQSRNFWCY